MAQAARRGTTQLWFLCLLWGLLGASLACATNIEVDYSFRSLNDGWNPPPFEEGAIIATLTSDSPISLLEPDDSFIQVGSQRFVRLFHWFETDTVSVVFVDEFGEHIALQLYPEPRYVFDPTNHTVPVIHLRTEPAHLWDLDTGIYVYGLHINWSRHGELWERPAMFEYWDNDGTLLVNRPVGMRVSGGNSRCYQQKSLRLYFDHHGAPEQLTFDFFGDGPQDFARILLRNGRYPYKLLFDSWATGLFADLGHELSRIKPVTVYLNDEYWGSYNLRERLDDEWLEITHGLDKDDFILIKDGDTENGNGQLWWDFLDWVGSPQDFTAHEFYEQASSQLDLASYIDWLIINIFSATSDNGIHANLVLMKVLDEPWQFVMWDEDSLLQDDNAETNLFRFFASQSQDEFMLWRPGNYPVYNYEIAAPFFTMFNHLMQNAQFRTRFSHRFDELMVGPMAPRNLKERLQAVADGHWPELTRHAAKFWGTNFSLFTNLLDAALDWIPLRHTLVIQQKAEFLQMFLAPVELSQFEAAQVSDGHQLVWRTESETGCLGFLVQKAVHPDGPYVTQADYLTEPSLVSAGGPDTPADYVFLVSAESSDDAVYYRLAHDDAQGGTVVHQWVEIVGTPVVEPPLLFINEFLALNTAGITDENGEYEDWVEIYNPGQQVVDLSGMFLTDDLLMDTRWEFPGGTTLDPGGYLIVWCDSDLEDGPLHASFKLSGAGEQCGLFSSVAQGHELIDSITFTGQSENISQGRQCDGCQEWVFFDAPTPGFTNGPGLSGLPEHHSGLVELSVYPNPFNPLINVEFELPHTSSLVAAIYNPAGRLVKNLKSGTFLAGLHSLRWDGRDDGGRIMPAGVYFLSLKTDGGVVGKKITLVK